MTFKKYFLSSNRVWIFQNSWNKMKLSAKQNKNHSHVYFRNSPVERVNSRTAQQKHSPRSEEKKRDRWYVGETWFLWELRWWFSPYSLALEKRNEFSVGSFSFERFFGTWAINWRNYCSWDVAARKTQYAFIFMSLNLEIRKHSIRSNGDGSFKCQAWTLSNDCRSTFATEVATYIGSI